MSSEAGLPYEKPVLLYGAEVRVTYTLLRETMVAISVTDSDLARKRKICRAGIQYGPLTNSRNPSSRVFLWEAFRGQR
jgi:hypothetical protein